MLALSPAGLYAFDDAPSAASDDAKLQDIFDERISIALAEILFTYGRSPETLLNHFRSWAAHGRRESIYWSERVLSGSGLAYGRRRSTSGAPVDAAEAELIGYRRLLRRIIVESGETLRARRGIVALVTDARSRGWGVAIARFPLGPELLSMEDALPAALLPGAIAEQTGTVFFDYTRDPRVRDLRVPDESHLDPENAAAFSRILAAHVAAWLGTGE